MTQLENEDLTGRDIVSHQVHMTGSGSGRPLVLLHSLLSDSASFRDIAPALSRSFQVLVPELPGFGRSAPAATLEAVADRMADAIAEVTRGQKAILLGNGYGSFVALQIAIRRPEIADRIVLAGCGAAFSEPGRQAFRDMRNAAINKGLEAITETAIRRLFSPEFQNAHPGLMADRRKAFLATSPDVFADACKALSELDIRQQATTVRIPALLVVGDQDAATPPAMAQELASLLPDSELKILSDCAHVPQLQAPQDFIEATSEFLARP